MSSREVAKPRSLAWMRSGTRIAAVVLCLVVSCMAGVQVNADDGWDLRINRVNVESVPNSSAHRVSARLSLVDEAGQPVPNLSVDTLTLRENSSVMPVDSIEPTREPINIVLVIDLSGSMGSAPDGKRAPFDEIKKAILALKDALGPQDELALVTFSTTVNTVLDFGLDHNAVINKVNGLSVEGWTCLYDGIYQGIDKSLQRPSGLRAVMVFTDGFDEGPQGRPCSTHTLQDVIAHASDESAQVPIYAVGLESANVARDELSQMAEQTGGRCFITPNASDFSGLFIGCVNQLKHQHLVYYTTEAPPGERTLTMSVKDPAHPERPPADSQAWSMVIPDLKAPVVAIAGLSTGQELRTAIEVTASAQSTKELHDLAIFLDGELLQESVGAGKEIGFLLDPTALASGPHRLEIVATDQEGATGKASIPFTVASEQEPSRPATQPRRITIGHIVLAVIVTLLVVLAASALLKRRATDDKHKLDTDPRAKEPDLSDQAPNPEPSSEQEAPRPVSRPRLVVQISPGLDPGTIFELQPRDLMIGRDSHNDVVLVDTAVSREHGVLLSQGPSYLLRDVGSKYGTRVNDCEVSSAGVLLEDGDTVYLGTSTQLLYREATSHGSETGEHLAAPVTHVNDN